MIASASAVGETIPLADAFPTSYDDHGPTHHLFVRLDDGDRVGYGEGAALKWFTGETASTMEAVAREELLPVVEGRSVVEALAAFRERAARLPGHPGAKAGVEMALLDLRAKRLGVPVHALLGTKRREAVPLAFASGALPAEEVAGNVADAYDAGFRTFKIKADGDADGDVARVDAVTRELADRTDPEDVFVRVDANTGWESYERAREVIERLARLEFVEYFEQPVAADAEGDLRALRTRLGVPVFADEAVHDAADLRRLVEGGDAPAVSGTCAKLAKAGSLAEIASLGRYAAARDRPVTLVSAFETSLGVAANLHLAAVLPRLSSAAELGANLIAHDPVAGHLDRDPEVPVPEGPGLGVDLDESVFE